VPLCVRGCAGLRRWGRRGMAELANH
jgi:hypothetical protein